MKVSPSPSLSLLGTYHKLVLKQTLTALFKTYGTVLGVVAHKNLRMRGQAFVSLESKEQAAKALKEVKGFPLYGKPMVSHLVVYFI